MLFSRLSDLYSEKKHFRSALTGTAFAVAGFLACLPFLDNQGLLIAVSILLASRLLAWRNWLRLLANRQNTLFPSITLLLTALLFSLWEHQINTMGLNLILMLFTIIGALESLTLAIMSPGQLSDCIVKPIALVASIVLLLYAALMLQSGNVPFGP